MNPLWFLWGGGRKSVILEHMVPKRTLASHIHRSLHTIQYWHSFIDKHETFTKIPLLLSENLLIS